jgi:hypothetical protein
VHRSVPWSDLEITTDAALGAVGPCGTCGGPSPELCGNGVDDDCDGVIDESTCR